MQLSLYTFFELFAKHQLIYNKIKYNAFNLYIDFVSVY